MPGAGSQQGFTRRYYAPALFSYSENDFPPAKRIVV